MMLMSFIVSGVPQGPAKLPDDDVTRPCFCRERPTENDFGAPDDSRGLRGERPYCSGLPHFSSTARFKSRWLISPCSSEPASLIFTPDGTMSPLGSLFNVLQAAPTSILAAYAWCRCKSSLPLREPMIRRAVTARQQRLVALAHPPFPGEQDLTISLAQKWRMRRILAGRLAPH